MFGFSEIKPKNRTHKGRHPNERKVIRGIIHKKCPICQMWIPETEFNKNIGQSDDKQGYCRRCQLLYQNWRRTVCKHYKVKRLQDIPGFVQPERGQEMRRYVADILAYGGVNNEE